MAMLSRSTLLALLVLLAAVAAEEGKVDVKDEVSEYTYCMRLAAIEHADGFAPAGVLMTPLGTRSWLSLHCACCWILMDHAVMKIDTDLGCIVIAINLIRLTKRFIV